MRQTDASSARDMAYTRFAVWANWLTQVGLPEDPPNSCTADGSLIYPLGLPGIGAGGAARSLLPELQRAALRSHFEGPTAVGLVPA